MATQALPIVDDICWTFWNTDVIDVGLASEKDLRVVGCGYVICDKIDEKKHQISEW